MPQNKSFFTTDKEHPPSKANLSSKKWLWLYFAALITLLFWGYLVTKTVPIFEYHTLVAETIPYEDVAPGWASRQPFRSILEPWLRWDTVWYLKIAKYGFQTEGTEVAFAPLYPFLAGIAGRLLGGQYLLASLLISWSAFLGACYLLNERIENNYAHLEIKNSIRNMIFFPTAFFFFAGYTESLFLLLVLLAWRYAEREKWLIVGLLGGLTVLTRFVGLFLLLPLGYIWWKKKSGKKFSFNVFSFLLIPFAYFGWLAYAKFSYNISPSEAIDQIWHLQFDWPWAGLFGTILGMKGEPIYANLSALFNFFAIAVVIWALFLLLKRKMYPEILFVGSLFLVSLMKVSQLNVWVSISRYVLPLFPIFLVQPSFLKKPLNDRIFFSAMVLLWLVCAALFFAWHWLA